MKGYGELWYSKENNYWSGGTSWDGRHGLGKLIIYQTKSDGTHYDIYDSTLIPLETHYLSFNWECPCTLYLEPDNIIFILLGYKTIQQDRDDHTVDTILKPLYRKHKKCMSNDINDDCGTIIQFAQRRQQKYHDEFYYGDAIAQPIELTITMKNDTTILDIHVKQRKQYRLLNIERAFDKCIKLQLCTFLVTKRIGYIQTRYHCITCTASNNHLPYYICEICANISSCHMNHQIELEQRVSDNDLLYCYCGAGGACNVLPTSLQYQSDHIDLNNNDRLRSHTKSNDKLHTADFAMNQLIGNHIDSYKQKLRQGRLHYKDNEWYPVDDWITKHRSILY